MTDANEVLCCGKVKHGFGDRHGYLITHCGNRVNLKDHRFKFLIQGGQNPENYHGVAKNKLTIVPQCVN